MSGSGASNLGYGNIPPSNNINPRYVNVDNSQYSGGFSSNEIPGFPGISGTKNNVDAAAGIFKGGAIKRKIKNITKHYKRMKAGSKKRKSLKRRLRRSNIARTASMQLAGRRRNTRRRSHSRRHRQRGGYSQYQNNLPMTSTYQVAGIPLSAADSALANPAPIKLLDNGVNCIDNYNHNISRGFPSRGH
jgi:hypothetical protein